MSCLSDLTAPTTMPSARIRRPQSTSIGASSTSRFASPTPASHLATGPVLRRLAEVVFSTCGKMSVATLRSA